MCKTMDSIAGRKDKSLRMVKQVLFIKLLSFVPTKERSKEKLPAATKQLKTFS